MKNATPSAVGLGWALSWLVGAGRHAAGAGGAADAVAASGPGLPSAAAHTIPAKGSGAGLVGSRGLVVPVCTNGEHTCTGSAAAPGRRGAGALRGPVRCNPPTSQVRHAVDALVVGAPPFALPCAATLCCRGTAGL